MMYEELGLVTPHRTATNRRRYSQRDIRRLQVIQHLTRERGVNLAGVRHILSLLEVVNKHDLAPPNDMKQAYSMYREIL
jgi:MerR family transcriptional regulator/heat shock protein HspR